jgi:hypothetical protein
VLVGVTAVVTLAVLLVGGCNGDAQKQPPATQPSRLSERTDDALADPFGYSPNFDRTDISGGDIDKFDKKGMDRDLKSVFNP